MTTPDPIAALLLDVNDPHLRPGFAEAWNAGVRAGFAALTPTTPALDALMKVSAALSELSERVQSIRDNLYAAALTPTTPLDDADDRWRLVRMATDLPPQWVMRSDRGERVTVEWGSRYDDGTYDLVFTVHPDDVPTPPLDGEETALAYAALQEAIRHAAMLRTESVTIQAPLARYLAAALADTPEVPTIDPRDGGRNER